MRLLTGTSASAPGKVILAGEYAVLEGAPCLVMAVDRRVQATLKIAPGRGFQIRSPGFLSAPCDLVWSSNQLSCDEGKLELLLKIINGLLALSPEISDSLQTANSTLTINTTALFDNQRKLGLGSSAALASAISGLLMKAGIALEAHWLTVHQIHSKAQGKLGSGVDIAASLLGGVSCFINHHHTHCELQRVNLPENIKIAFIWTGNSASTPKYLQSLSRWKQTHAETYQRNMDTMRGHMAALVSNMGDAHSVVAGLKRFVAALYEFARVSGVDVFAHGHEALYQAGYRFDDLVYKPCGAGGGDLGIAVTPNTESLEAFLSKAKLMGLSTIDLNIDPNGLLTS